jgi:hypothetical protein
MTGAAVECKGICNGILEKFKGIGGKRGMQDRMQYRYCSRCAFFFKTDSVYCKCCRCKLRFLMIGKRKLMTESAQESIVARRNHIAKENGKS